LTQIKPRHTAHRRPRHGRLRVAGAVPADRAVDGSPELLLFGLV